MQINESVLPRRWQEYARERWRLEKRGVVKVVTGGGKTIFACFCMYEFLAMHPDGRIVIIVPTTALLDQWAVDICMATSLQEDDIASFSGRAKSSSLRKINILVINTGRGLAEKLFSETDEPLMLIVDECHRAGAVENAKAMRGKYRATLGLSATPERESDDGFEERIAPVLGPVIYRYDYKEAHRDEVIVDFDLINIEIQDAAANPDAGDAKTTRQAREQALRLMWAEKLISQHSGERVIVFHERVGAIEILTDMLHDKGASVVSYHSGQSPAHRRDNLRLFRRGQFRVLTTCRALDEGANIPEASVAIIARSTKSTRQRIQRLGRVLRTAPGKEVATVYTLYMDAAEQQHLLAEQQGLEGVAQVSWRRGRSW